MTQVVDYPQPGYRYQCITGSIQRLCLCLCFGDLSRLLEARLLEPGLENIIWTRTWEVLPCHMQHALMICSQGFDKEYDRVLDENKQLQRRLAQVDTGNPAAEYREVNKKSD